MPLTVLRKSKYASCRTHLSHACEEAALQQLPVQPAWVEGAPAAQQHSAATLFKHVHGTREETREGIVTCWGEGMDV
jgi:copper(I)-binding protein